MYYRTFLSCMLGVALSAIGVGKIGAQEPAYTVAQAYALHNDPNGIEGTVQLLIDKRLAGAIQDELWGKGDWSFVSHPVPSFMMNSRLTPRTTQSSESRGATERQSRSGI